MLQISSEQETAFKQSAIEDYQDRMVIHIGEFFPKHYAKLGDENTRTLIQYGIDQAKTYQLYSERDVCLFIDLLIALGLDFDDSEDYPWAKAMLTDKNYSDSKTRIDSVHAKAMQELKERQ